MTDTELLNRYVTGDEHAFSELVSRHLDLVYGTALRSLSSHALAEEVTQTAFLKLARNAHALPEGTILPAWLYRVTRHTATDIRRSETRRQIREQTAVDIAAMNTPSEWTHLEPMLDEAIEELAETDRSLVVLRYFDKLSLREASAVLGLSVGAAQKRLSRAVEQMRQFFIRKGVPVAAVMIVAALSVQSATAAPAALPSTIAAAAAKARATWGRPKRLPTRGARKLHLAGTFGLAGLAILLLYHPLRRHAEVALSDPSAADQAPRAATVETAARHPTIRPVIEASPVQGAKSPTKYSVSGQFSYQVYSLGTNGEIAPRDPLFRQFEVSVDECKWKIRIVLLGNTPFDSFVYSYDGSKLSHYAVPLDKNGSAMPSVTVEPCPVPATITSAAGEYVWLAFASACYFKQQTNSTATAFEQLRSNNGLTKRYEIPCQTTLSTTAPYLPEAVIYTQDFMRVLRPDGEIDKIPFAAPFEEGYTSGQYVAGNFTNVAGLQLPTVFEYRKFHNFKSPPFCGLLIQGTVTNISTSMDALDTRLPEQRLMVQDQRTAGPALLYPVNAGEIPETNSDTVEAARQRTAKHTR